MTNKVVRLFLVFSLSATAIPSADVAKSQVTPSQVRFTCGTSEDPNEQKSYPTTLAYFPQANQTAIIRWKKDWGKEWPAKRRCEVVSPKFQQAYEQGLLNYLTWGYLSKSPQDDTKIICAAKHYGGRCDLTLFTLSKEDDPWEVMQNLNYIIQGSASTVINQSTGKSQAYIRFDVESFLNRTE